MKFQSGDKVSFINEKLEGIVQKSLPANLYRVEIEDGFTLDVNENEIVLQQAFLRRTASPEKQSISKEIIPELSAVFKDTKGFQMVILPLAQQVLNGKLQCWLINHTAAEQLYAVTVYKGKSEELLKHGLLLNEEAVLITEYTREEYLESPRFRIRWIECQNGKIPAHSNRVVTTEFPSLVQIHPKLPSPYCFAGLYPLNAEDVLMNESPDLEMLTEKFGKITVKAADKNPGKSGITSGDKSVYKRYGLNPSLLEIDLHIEELADDPSGIPAADMLALQLGSFRRALDKALLARQSELTVIHGVGNGRLKAAIRKELNEQGLRFEDAPYEKYGSGATRIIL
jgi:hypothetical protein